MTFSNGQDIKKDPPSERQGGSEKRSGTMQNHYIPLVANLKGYLHIMGSKTILKEN
jgi:hypothetical protein